MAMGCWEVRREQPLRNGLSSVCFEMVPSSLRIFPKGSVHFLTSLTLSFADRGTSVLEEILNDEEMTSSVSRLKEPPNFLISLVPSIVCRPKTNLTRAAALSQSWREIINTLAKETNLPLLSSSSTFGKRTTSGMGINSGEPQGRRSCDNARKRPASGTPIGSLSNL